MLGIPFPPKTRVILIRFLPQLLGSLLFPVPSRSSLTGRTTASSFVCSSSLSTAVIGTVYQVKANYLSATKPCEIQVRVVLHNPAKDIEHISGPCGMGEPGRKKGTGK